MTATPGTATPKRSHLSPSAAFQTEGKLYLILDFLRGGDLFTRLSKEVHGVGRGAVGGCLESVGRGWEEGLRVSVRVYMHACWVACACVSVQYTCARVMVVGCVVCIGVLLVLKKSRKSHGEEVCCPGRKCSSLRRVRLLATP